MQTYEQIASDVMEGKNPLVPFNMTYGMHQELIMLGAFLFSHFGRTCAVTQLRYRVLHRESPRYVTQNTWSYGDRVPRMEEQ